MLGRWLSWSLHCYTLLQRMALQSAEPRPARCSSVSRQLGHSRQRAARALTRQPGALPGNASTSASKRSRDASTSACSSIDYKPANTTAAENTMWYITSDPRLVLSGSFIKERHTLRSSPKLLFKLNRNKSSEIKIIHSLI